MRVWTKDATKAAPPEAQAAFVAQIEEAKAKLKASQNVTANDKPHWSSRADYQGKKEGQVQMFQAVREGRVVVLAAQWSVMSNDWIEVGEVAGSASGGTIDGARARPLVHHSASFALSPARLIASSLCPVEGATFIDCTFSPPFAFPPARPPRSPSRPRRHPLFPISTPCLTRRRVV